MASLFEGVWRICALAGSAKLRQTVAVPLSATELDQVLERIAEGAVPSSLESGELDFKRQPDSRNDAIKTLVDAAVCFANADGGTVVMGVANATDGVEAPQIP